MGIWFILLGMYKIVYLLIMNTLDVMHCEMNMGKNILKTITKDKDTMKMKWDLQRIGLHQHLWLTFNPRRLGKFLKPTTPFVLTTFEFDFCVQPLKH
jgi:hypothetical protein